MRKEKTISLVYRIGDCGIISIIQVCTDKRKANNLCKRLSSGIFKYNVLTLPVNVPIPVTYETIKT